MSDSRAIPFAEIAQTCARFADHVRARRERIHAALASYSSMPAVDDEIARATYLLENLHENRDYFESAATIENVASFLPRNQLLYATLYMGVMPALLSHRCVVRPPESAHDAYRRLLDAVDFTSFFPNLEFFLGDRREFVARHVPTADVVMFTGTHANGEAVRKQTKKDALFLFSGAGHNPVIVRGDADVALAAESVIRLCYHNQGQDCSAPNAVLVDRAVSGALFDELLARTLAVEAAMRLGRHPGNPIAPNTDRAHLATTAETFLKLQPFLVHGGVIDTKSQIISPTIFRKPLKHGPQLGEFFAPVIMLQEYDTEDELHAYFDHPRYRPNAMYLTVFGGDARIAELGELDVHPPETVLHNRDLHEEEKGTHPYGGYGSEASFIGQAGTKRPSPILPQREIHRYLSAPRNASRDGRQPRVRSARDARIEKRNKLIELGLTAYTSRLTPTARCLDLVNRYSHLSDGETTTDRAVVAGRVVAYRNSGMFLELRDSSGHLQVLCHESELRAPDLGALKLIDVGDLLAVDGVVRRTRRGELTLAARTLSVLAKDLLSSANDVPAERRRKLLARSEAMAAIRTALAAARFQDVETWTLESPWDADPAGSVQLESGAVPRFGALIADGFVDRAYELRGLSGDREAQPGQSLVVEALQAFADARDMTALTERLIGAVAERLRETGFMAADGIDLSAPFARLSLLAAVERETGADFAAMTSDDEARSHAARLGCEIAGTETWGECAGKVFAARVAPALVAPVHVTHLPKALSRAAVASAHDPRLTESFATYVNGRLIAKGASLLTDPFAYSDRTADEHGEDFAAVLQRGMPPAAFVRAAIGRLRV
jgi:lysyl-tRNA synthetase class II/acyl-CoA reductase-like NAD-dependent aldehyde dehydrogenase